MKKLVLGFVLLTGLSTANAGVVRLKAQCFISSQGARCDVVNYKNFPMQCVIRAFGQTRNGQTLESVTRAKIQPGMGAYSFVETHNYYNYFVRAWGTATCRY